MTWLMDFWESTSTIREFIYDLVQTYWYSLSVSLLFLSIAMAFSFAPAVLCNNIYREGSKFEKNALKLWFYLPPFGIVVGLRYLLNNWIEKIKAKSDKVDKFGGFNGLNRLTDFRRVLYFISEYLMIGLIGFIFFKALAFLLPDVTVKVSELVELNSGRQTLILNFKSIVEIVKYIIIPTSTAGIIFIAIAVFMSVPLVSGMFFEPYKNSFKTDNFFDTPLFCQKFAKKWFEQVSCLGIILTAFELITKYSDLEWSLINHFAQAEVYATILFTVEIIASLVFLLPLAFVYWLRKRPEERSERSIISYFIDGFIDGFKKGLTRMRSYNAKKWIPYVSFYAYLIFFIYTGAKLVFDPTFRNQIWTQTISNIAQQLEAFSFIDLGSLCVVAIIIIVAMRLSTVSPRLSLLTTIECAGLAMFVINPAIVNTINNKIESGISMSDAVASVFWLFMIPLALLFANGLIGLFSTKFKVISLTGKKFTSMTRVTTIISVSWGLVCATICYAIFVAFAVLLNWIYVCHILTILTTLLCLKLEWENHLAQEEPKCECDNVCPCHQ